MRTYQIRDNPANDCVTLEYFYNDNPPRPFADYDTLEDALQSSNCASFDWTIVDDKARNTYEIASDILAIAEVTE